MATVICISSRKEISEALAQHLPQEVRVVVVSSFLQCFEQLNSIHPKAIVVDMADTTIDDCDMATLLPEEGSEAYIPLISLTSPPSATTEEAAQQLGRMAQAAAQHIALL